MADAEAIPIRTTSSILSISFHVRPASPHQSPPPRIHSHVHLIPTCSVLLFKRAHIRLLTPTPVSPHLRTARLLCLVSGLVMLPLFPCFCYFTVLVFRLMTSQYSYNVPLQSSCANELVSAFPSVPSVFHLSLNVPFLTSLVLLIELLYFQCSWMATLDY
jgi:hypothetical protein